MKPLGIRVRHDAGKVSGGKGGKGGAGWVVVDTTSGQRLGFVEGGDEADLYALYDATVCDVEFLVAAGEYKRLASDE